MLFYLLILLRISPFKQSQHLTHKKKVKYGDKYDECKVYQDENQNFSNEEFDFWSFFYCGSSSASLQFIKCSYSNAKMTANLHAYFIHSKNANLNIQQCNFNNIEYNDELIYAETSGLWIPDVLINLQSNTISKCNCWDGESIIILLYYPERCNFDNNTIYFDPNIKNGRAFSIYYHSDCVFTNNKIFNAIYDEGCGIYFKEKGSKSNNLQISDSTFTNCRGKNGGSTIYIPDVDFDLCFTNMIFEYSKNFGSEDSTTMINIESSSAKPKFTLKDCQFRYLESNSRAGAGIGLLFKSSDKKKDKELIFINTTFEHICGQAISIRASCPNTNTNVDITDCRLLNVSSDTFGGAVYFDSDANTISIKNSRFNRTVSKSEGHSIYIFQSDANVVEISSCHFIDCGADPNTYSVQIYSLNLDFIENEFVFTDHSKSCCCIKSTGISRNRFIGNTFKCAHCDNTANSAGIDVQKISGQVTTIEILNNTFDSFTGKADGLCFNVHAGSGIETLTIKSNIIQNCLSSGILTQITLAPSIESYEITDFTFINNSFSDESLYDKTYPSLQVFVVFPNNDKSVVTFNDCEFINNSSPRQGGGFIFKGSETNKNSKYTFDSCRFSENTAKEQGSALAILTAIDCEITNCVFINNKSNTKGGSVYFETKDNENVSPAVIVTNCVFDGSQGENGGINIDNSPTAQVSFVNNSYSNCGQTGYTVNIQSEVASCSVKQCKIEFTDANECGGFSIKCKGEIEISYIEVLNALSNTALLVHSSDSSNKVTIDHCVFDSCNGTNYACFDISIYSTSLIFEDSVIQNIYGKSDTKYFGSIAFKGPKANLEISNITFINNSCSSLFGGGSGLQFEGVSGILFNECVFKNNEAHQDKSNSRYKDGLHPFDYYNGDGGAIQIGLIERIDDIKLTFNSCQFLNNRAFRHGGAIAVQTIREVEISHCTFENNAANINFESTEKILEDHFYKKTEGRGGALYINPASSLTESAMAKITIDDCKFRWNTAYDGYAIYIEGDDTGAEFVITNNNFNDNYNASNHDQNDAHRIIGAVIATEIHSLTAESLHPGGQTSGNNYFSNTDQSLVVDELIHVDHYGNTKTKEFSESDYFPSADFTFSSYFSHSMPFSNTAAFSESNDFTTSNTLIPYESAPTSDDLASSSVESFDDSSSSVESVDDSSSSSGDIEQESSSTSDDEISSEHSSASKGDDIQLTSGNADEETVETAPNGIGESTTEIIINGPTNEQPTTSQKDEIQIQTTASSLFETAPVVIDRDPGSSNLSRSNKKAKLSVIVGVVVGVLALIVIVLLIVIFLTRRKRKPSSNGEDQNEMEEQANSSMILNEQDEFDNPLYNGEIAKRDPFEECIEEYGI